MPLRRSRDLIIAQILSLCQGDGAGKTRIVYQVNLNFKTANVHLDLLLKKGLLEAIPVEPIMYKTGSSLFSVGSWLSLYINSR